MVFVDLFFKSLLNCVKLMLPSMILREWSGSNAVVYSVTMLPKALFSRNRGLIGMKTSGFWGMGIS